MPDYSVIVPAYRASAALPRCLRALRHQTIHPARYEIVVVDDGSGDETPAVAEQALSGFENAKVIHAPHGGPAAARNIGARRAQGALLLFTDADCEPAPDWIERMARVFTDAGIAGAKGVYRTRQRSLVARFVQQEYQDKYDRMARLPAIDFVDTYSAAYRRSVFAASGGFDTSFIMDEDQELSFRLSTAGHKLVFTPDAVVGHRHVETVGGYLRRKVGIGYWKALLLRYHPGKVVRDSHTPQVIKAQMGLLALAFASSAGWLASRLARRPVGRWAGLTLGLWLQLILTMLPLLSKIARRDPAVLSIAPVLIVLRALGLGVGLMVGTIHFSLRPIRIRISDGPS